VTWWWWVTRDSGLEWANLKLKLSYLLLLASISNLTATQIPSKLLSVCRGPFRWLCSHLYGISVSRFQSCSEPRWSQLSSIGHCSTSRSNVLSCDAIARAGFGATARRSGTSATPGLLSKLRNFELDVCAETTGFSETYDKRVYWDDLDGIFSCIGDKNISLWYSPHIFCFKWVSYFFLAK